MEKDKFKETDLFDYLNWRGDINFSCDGFNKIDGMILSRFVYAPFEFVFGPGKRSATIEEACKVMLAQEDIEKIVLKSKDVDLFKALIESERYANLRLSNYVNIIDTVEETQFSAITVHITDEFHVVVFRGTDDSIIGWKEDLNMGFIFPITSQVLSLKYLKGIARLTKGELIIAGHSKGGNLAVYSSAYAPEEVQDRIVRIYNYDGPGFMDEVTKSEGYKRICDKARTYVPQGSVVGVMLGHKEKHAVIHSMQAPMSRQHSMYTWAVSGRNFVKEEGTNAQSRYLDDTMKEWFSRMDRDERELFFETAYSVIKEMEEKKVEDLKSMDAFKMIFNSFKEMDDDTKKVLNEGLKLLMASVKNTFNIGK